MSEGQSEEKLELGKEVDTAVDFRLRSKRLILTFKTHLNKERLQDHIEEVSKIKLKFFRAAHETADKENPYLHTHCVIEFDCKSIDKKKAQRLFDIFNEEFTEMIHPNIKVIVDKRHWENCLNYLAKEDPDNADLKVDKRPLAEIVWAAESIQDVMKMVKKPSDVLGLAALYGYRPIEKVQMEKKLKIWELALEKRIFEPAPHRKIEWWWEDIGNVGKSEFAKYLCTNHPEKATFFDTLVYRETAFQMTELFGKQRWKGDTIFIDLPRDFEEWTTFYRTLEMVKNGMCKSAKYQGGVMIRQHQVHLIVFANFLPDLNKLSYDRWIIRKILASELEYPPEAEPAAAEPAAPPAVEEPAAPPSGGVNITGLRPPPRLDKKRLAAMIGLRPK